MNKSILLTLSILVTMQTFAAQEGRKISKCCGLDDAAYRVLSVCGRNDYLYLANVDAKWFLNMKIRRKENIADLDRYWPRAVTNINAIRGPNQHFSFAAYRTALHEAVEQGNLDCIKLLCAAGADKNKVIKGTYETNGTYSVLQCMESGRVRLLKNDTSEEAYNAGCVHTSESIEPEKFEDKVQNILHGNYIGLSAVDLAEKLAKDAKDTDFVPLERRKAVHKYLVGLKAYTR